MKASEIIEKRKKLWEEHQDITKDRGFIEATAKHLVSEKGKSLRKEIKEHPELLIELFFVIESKDGKTMPFFLNKVQEKFQNILNQAIRDYKDGKRNFLDFIVLKGRQQGFTSYITAKQLCDSIVKQNFSGFTLSDLDENTHTIFQDKAKFPYNQLPDALKPTEKFNNRREFHFSKLNSRWRVATAGNEEVGRSKTVRFFHGSEVAFWKNLKKILAGMGEAIAKGAIKILETTANGHNDFKIIWDDAVKGNNSYVPLFFEWWETPEYRLDFEDDEKEREFKDRVENSPEEFYIKLKTLQKEKGLDWDQLYWYESKRKVLKDLLPQEYPCSAEEAFLFSGRPYFDIGTLQQLLLREPKKPVETRQNESIVIFEKPIPGETYISGSDVAEGLPEGDYSHTKFYKLSTWEEVAFIHGHFSPDRFGELIVEYAKYYNDAFVAVERNNHGHTVLNEIYKHLEYENIYIETVHDQKTDKKTKKLGWHTNEASKYLMLDELDSAIRNDELIINDIETVKELISVAVEENGKVILNSKDRVVALAISWQMRKHHTTGFLDFFRDLTYEQKQEQ